MCSVFPNSTLHSKVDTPFGMRTQWCVWVEDMTDIIITNPPSAIRQPPWSQKEASLQACRFSCDAPFVLEQFLLSLYRGSRSSQPQTNRHYFTLALSIIQRRFPCPCPCPILRVQMLLPVEAHPSELSAVILISCHMLPSTLLPTFQHISWSRYRITNTAMVWLSIFI